MVTFGIMIAIGIAYLCAELVRLILPFAPILITLFVIFSIIGIIFFLIIEYIIKKYFKSILQKIIPQKIELINLLERVVNIIIILIKIYIPLFAVALLIGFFSIFKEKVINVYFGLLIAISLQLIIIIILKLLHKKIQWLINIFLLIEPYILTLIVYFIAIRQ